MGPDIGKTPLATIDGKIIYLNDVAKFDYKKRQETSFYRINGLNTIYLSIFADTETNIIKASAEATGKDSSKFDGWILRDTHE